MASILCHGIYAAPVLGEHQMNTAATGWQICQSVGFCIADVHTQNYCWDDLSYLLAHPPAKSWQDQPKYCTQCNRLIIEYFNSTTSGSPSNTPYFSVGGLKHNLDQHCGQGFLSTGTITQPGKLKGHTVSDSDIFISFDSPVPRRHSTVQKPSRSLSHPTAHPSMI
ncbi:uncharacterized protein BJ171DRAFT_580831 [Polychytrium aggregatum]|uniref:uncharacterized protein n=1 Tax=Polychytrium aggregatum TaxID=110093 RepID=UPI0022FE6DA5|nr:uncharacterized protein BJ171DRAFT_580831 [Polychytrium aggregatum]KAI9205656.1 hypothetical protein BJ171DRAFT_580831 [Polychytrium aggregatum]